MKVDYFTIPEITVSFKDTVKKSERAIVKTSLDAYKILSVALEDCLNHHEEVYALYLDKGHRVMGVSCVSKGGIDKTAVDIRIILQTALKVSATYTILSHNHPSGSSRPSPEDITLTNNIRKGCEAIGITLLDHLIVADESCYTSFADEGLL